MDLSLCAFKRSPPCSRQKRVTKCSKRGLELLLLTLTWLSSLTGTASNGVQNPSQKRLNRILGGSVLLPVDIPTTETVTRIEWEFQGGNGLKFLLAEYWDGKLQRTTASERFGQRLEMANETTLRIKDLEMEDSGRYTIKVRFPSGLYQEDTFGISVYKPVPEPKILPQYLSNSPDGCNVTLKCLVPGKRGLNISWKRGDPLMDLEDGSDWYHLSGNGTDLHVFWQLNSSKTNITCLVTNPVDQKSISVNLLNICQTESKPEPRLPWGWILLIILFVILVLLLAAFGIQTWKKRRKEPLNRDASTMPKEETTQYAEVVKRSPPEGDDDQEDDGLSDAIVSSPSPYALLQLPTRSEQVT